MQLEVKASDAVVVLSRVALFVVVSRVALFVVLSRVALFVVVSRVALFVVVSRVALFGVYMAGGRKLQLCYFVGFGRGKLHAIC